MEDEYGDHSDQTMKVVVIHNLMAEEDLVEVSVGIVGNQVLSECENRTKECILLIGLINLEYPMTQKNTFEVFQKLLLELDGAKLLKKVHSLKSKLME